MLYESFENPCVLNRNDDSLLRTKLRLRGPLKIEKGSFVYIIQYVIFHKIK